MLQSLDISADDTSPAPPSARPVKLNAVVTKGKIRVVPKPRLQVVKPVTIEGEDRATPMPEDCQAAPERTDPDEAAPGVQPAAPAAPATWNQGFSEARNDPQTIDSELLPPQEPPMKMIKLIAAAAVLGIAAIALTFLQFSGSDTAGQNDALTADQDFSPVIAAADASTLPAAAALLTAPQAAGNNADIVAQITAGTLQALRNGSETVATTTASSAPKQPAVATGEPNGLYAMVLTALQQGQSRQYIDQMVNEAHRAQQVTVPAVLLTSSGEVNTSALLTLFGGQ